MNNKQFITKHKARIEQGEKNKVYKGETTKRHSSLVATDDKIYSYGYHYPLLFQIETPTGKKWCRNVMGYSVTTSKHIGLAGGSDVIDVELPYKGSSWGEPVISFDDVQRALIEQSKAIKEQMQSKKRKDTKVYSGLEHQLEQVNKNIEALNS